MVFFITPVFEENWCLIIFCRLILHLQGFRRFTEWMNGLEWMHFVSFSSSFPRRSGEERRLPNKPQLSRSVMDVFRLDSWKAQVGLQRPDEKSITDSILFTHIGSKDKWRAEDEIWDLWAWYEVKCEAKSHSLGFCYLSQLLCEHTLTSTLWNRSISPPPC